MNYKFTYKSNFEKRKPKQWLNIIASDFLFFLYDNWLFKKLKLDKNQFLKSHVEFGKNKKVPRIYKSKIPENPKLDIHSITFFDCIENEDSIKLRNRLIKIVSKYKGGFLSEEPSKKLKKAFEKFDSAYKTTSWGSIFFNDTKDIEELDLIDGISYGYVKGAQSHFILTYTVFPSEKFKSLFKQSLKEAITDKSEIQFKSFREMIKTKRLFSSIGFNVKQPGFWTEKLFNEINFQLKSIVTKSLKLGAFNSQNNLLFPRFTSFEYDPNELVTYQDELFNLLKIGRHEYYKDSNEIFTLKNIDYSKKSSNSMELFIPIKTEDEKKANQLNNISYISNNYISAIAPFWVLINISSLNKQNIVFLRKQTFIYIRKNRVTIFLKRAVKLKNKLSLDWISFERIRKDFSSKIFKEQLVFHGIPNALNKPWFKGAKAEEFKSNLEHSSKYSSMDIKKSYEEILELFSHISEDNTVRANMRLQRLLFIMAIIGIILAIYGANSAWFNSWVEYFLNSYGIEIPKVE